MLDDEASNAAPTLLLLQYQLWREVQQCSFRRSVKKRFPLLDVENRLVISYLSGFARALGPPSVPLLLLPLLDPPLHNHNGSHHELQARPCLLRCQLV